MTDRDGDGAGGHEDRAGLDTDETDPPGETGSRPERESIPIDTGTDTEPIDTPAGGDPGPEPATADRGPDPGPNATRNWTVMTATLALISVLTAVAIAAIHDTTTAPIGATALAIGFGAILGFDRLTEFDVVDQLARGWAENRLYVWLATGLFGFGGLIGALLVAGGVDLTELIMELLLEEFDDDDMVPGEGLELTATFFITNNTPPFLASIIGAATLGLVTVVIMVFNGVIVGNLVFALGPETGFGLMFALLAPHGIFELPALFIAAGIGFRLLHRAGQRILGTRDAMFTRAYLRQTGLLVVFGWFVLVLAAFVEAYLTIPIAELFFPEAA